MSILALDLSPAIVAILNRIARSRLYGTAIVQRAKCILFAYRKRQFTDISTLLRLSAKAVGRWVKRFRGSLDALRQVESNGVKSVLFRQVVDCLRDALEVGILKNMASRRAFLSDRSRKIRFVYIPKHSSWLNQIEAVFGMINRRVMRGGSFTSKQNLMDKLTRFTSYFNDKIAKPMKWTYTGRPMEMNRWRSPEYGGSSGHFERNLRTIRYRTELKGFGTSA